ncbi:17356_t:CDS:2, partial [Racocetra fulgida]
EIIDEETLSDNFIETSDNSDNEVLDNSENNFESSILNQPELLISIQPEPSMSSQSESLMSNQMLKKNKNPCEYSINDYVCLMVPKINHNSIDQYTLPCKIIEELPNQTYRLQCKNGILDSTYCANEIMPLGLAIYEELEVCQEKTIGIREAARMQSTSTAII